MISSSQARSTLLLWFAVLFAILGRWPRIAEVHADEHVSARFLTEAPAQWAELVDEARQGITMEWIVRFGAPVEDGATVGGSAVDRQIRGGEIAHLARLLNSNELVMTTQLFGPRKGSERMEVVNDDYAFMLNRTTAAGTWLLSGVDRRVDSVRQHGMMPAAKPIFAGIMLEGAWLDQVVASADFAIASATLTNEGAPNEECQIVFTSRFPIDAHNTILGGTMWLAPRNRWVLNRYVIDEQSDDLGKVEAEFEYQTLGTLALPKRFTTTFRFPEETRYAYAFEPAKRFRGSASEFRLSAFGLPEPSGLARTEGFSYWIWINVLALGLLIAAVILRRYAKRAAT
jgi:hypothetical protein